MVAGGDRQRDRHERAHRREPAFAAGSGYGPDFFDVGLAAAGLAIQAGFLAVFVAAVAVLLGRRLRG
jgi:hypothetical protein